MLLNAEWDHPDVFADEAAVLDAFEALAARARARRRGRWSPTWATRAWRGWWLELADGWPGRVVRVALAPDEAPASRCRRT